MTFRVGTGYDVHPLVQGRPFICGGVLIPSPFGPDGHSDADVLIHALCDALLGALGLGDIGRHFPDSDPAYRGINSTILLARVVSLMEERGWGLVNADMTVILERPKIAAFISAMQDRLAGLVNVAPDRLNIKATTTERLGFEGRGEGIAAQAVVLLERRSATSKGASL